MITTVLFDLGGVLEQIVAAPRIEAWTHGQIPSEQFWHRWLHSPAVRAFESGKSSPEQFAHDAVLDLGLDIAPADFLHDFGEWLAGPYPGAQELVQEVRNQGYRVASFSNSNPVHWPTMIAHQKTETVFDANFPSHQLGALKPDREAFDAVVAGLQQAANTVLFLDDNQINVEGARAAGLHAERVEGVIGAREKLQQLGILSSASGEHAS